MFELKATLVNTTALRPWRTGWSMERGVDFSLAYVADRPATQATGLPCERACFIEEDGFQAAGATVVRRFTSLAAGGARPEPDAGPDSPMRAWWSLTGKPSRT